MTSQERAAYLAAYPDSALAGNDFDDYNPDSFTRPRGDAVPVQRPTKWYDRQTPLAKKAYLTGFPESKHNGEAQSLSGEHIKNRRDYHDASQAFHQGKYNHLDRQMKLIPEKDRVMGNKPAEYLSASRHHHDRLSHLHDEAKSHMDQYHKSKDVREADQYKSKLDSIHKTYGDLEAHEKKFGNPVGSGHTRFVTK